MVKYLALSFVVLILAGGPAFAAGPAAPAQPAARDAASGPGEPEPPAPAAATPWWQWDRAGGDWAGLRPKLEDAGLTIGGDYVAEHSAVLAGGLRRRESFRNLLTLDAQLETQPLLGIPGGTFFIQYLHVNAERGGSLDSGDIQVYSNLENARSLDVIYELWYEQRLADDRLRIKIGKADVNSEFAFVNAAGEFSNSSAGYSPAILGFPTYPDPAMSVQVFVTPWRTEDLDLTLGYGLFDGAAGVDGLRTGARGPSTFFSSEHSDDFFHIAQAALAWQRLGPLADGRLSVGLWWHSGAFARWAGGSTAGTGGFQLSLEQRLWAPSEDDERGWYVFAQYAWADEKVAAVAQHLAVGLVARGLVPGRDADSAGLYLSYVDLSDDPAAGFARNETVLDAYYRVQVTPAIFVQPELQYILRPSGDPTIANALVAGLRLGITF